jgi:hypothetical protein
LSTPVETSTAVVVADYRGYLHWLDKDTGTLIAREQVSKFRVGNQPVAMDDTVVVLDDGGKMAAFRANPAAAKPAATTAPATQPIAPPPPPGKPAKASKSSKSSTS